MSGPSDGGGGGRPLFAAAEERDMVTWLVRCTALGLVITREMFLEEVQRIVQLEQRGAKSVDVLQRWISEFRSRHSAELDPTLLLPEREAAGLAARRSPQAWYRSVSAALAERRPPVGRGAFSDPARVLYLGEANLRLERRTASVAALRVTPPPAESAAGDNVAFVQAVSASGERAPPMLVLPAGELIRDDLPEEDACFRQTTSCGHVTPTTLVQYMVKSLEPHLTAGSVPRPVLIYVNGLRHHCSLTLTQFCDDEGIILVGLPPGGQARNPLFQSVTSLLAANFERLAAETRLGRRRSSPSGALTLSLKYLLAGINQACRRVCKETVAQAFTSSSLFPWGERVAAACVTPDVLPSSNCTPRRPPAKKAKTATSRTVLVCQPDTDITIKQEQLSPPAESADISWDTDLLSGADRPKQPAGRRSENSRNSNHDRSARSAADRSPTERSPPERSPPERSPPARSPPDSERTESVDSDDPDDAADQPNPLVLPQARLTDYLSALDAAGGALGSRRGAQQAALLELKEKLRALHAASSALSGDCPEPPAAAPAAPAAHKPAAPAPAAPKANAGVPKANGPDSTQELVCVVSGCSADCGQAWLHRVPADRPVAAVLLEKCGKPAHPPVTARLAVVQRGHTVAGSPADNGLLPASAAMTFKSNRLTPSAPPPATASPAVPASPSRAARGIKRPRRFDDFQCVDDAVLRPTAESAASEVSSDMTELANKPPAALKSIIKILRAENAALRERLESEQGRGRSLAEGLERAVRDYHAAALP